MTNTNTQTQTQTGIVVMSSEWALYGDWWVKEFERAMPTVRVQGFMVRARLPEHSAVRVQGFTVRARLPEHSTVWVFEVSDNRVVGGVIKSLDDNYLVGYAMRPAAEALAQISQHVVEWLHRGKWL